MEHKIDVIDGKVVVSLEEPKYYIEYRHPSGDFRRSSETTLSEVEEEFDYRPITEQLFVDLMKKNFKTRKTTRESNIQIIKEVNGIKTVIYEQKKF